MPKLSTRVPRLSLHKASGQSVVRLHGRDIYLGKHGSAASQEAYQRFVAEWSESGGRMSKSQHSTTLTEVVVAYTEFATGYYRKDGEPTNEVRMIKSATAEVVNGTLASVCHTRYSTKIAEPGNGPLSICCSRCCGCQVHASLPPSQPDKIFFMRSRIGG